MAGTLADAPEGADLVSADLVVVSLARTGGTIDATRQPDLCDLVMEAGRPVLLIPPARPPVAFDAPEPARPAIASNPVEPPRPP